MIYNTLILAYQVALGALMLAVFVKGTGQMKRTAIVLATVYGVQLFLSAHLWPSLAWSICMGAVDALAIRPVTWRPAGTMQSLVGWAFLLQFGVHAGRIIAELNGKIIDINSYWWALTLLAFLQLCFAGGWIAREYFGGHRNLGRSMGDPRVSPARSRPSTP